jgi:hypothetical protein
VGLAALDPPYTLHRTCWANQFVPAGGVSVAGGWLEAVFKRCAAVDSALRLASFLFLCLSALDLLCPAMVASEWSIGKG